MAGIEDLELEVDKPSRMIVLHPATNLPMKTKDTVGEDGQPIEGRVAYVDVYSSDSQTAVKLRQEIKTARLRQRNPNAMTGAKLESEGVELLAALTAGWFLVSLSGDPVDLEFSRENARKLYANHKMAWLYEQVDAHAGARGNFSKASSPS